MKNFCIFVIWINGILNLQDFNSKFKCCIWEFKANCDGHLLPSHSGVTSHYLHYSVNIISGSKNKLL